MITRDNLIHLGFDELLDIFSGKEIWGLGEMEVQICDNTCKLPIITYNIESQKCKVIRDYCIIVRECKTEHEIKKFVECVTFLFNLMEFKNDKYYNIL